MRVGQECLQLLDVTGEHPGASMPSVSYECIAKRATF